MFDTRSDEERLQERGQMGRPRLSACREHRWGVWMRDVLIVKIPGGIKLLPQPDTHYRRFCRACGEEQKGRGSAWGENVEAA